MKKSIIIIVGVLLFTVACSKVSEDSQSADSETSQTVSSETHSASFGTTAAEEASVAVISKEDKEKAKLLVLAEENGILIKETYLADYKASDGSGKGIISFTRPICQGGSEAAKTINQVYDRFEQEFHTFEQENISGSKMIGDRRSYWHRVSCRIVYLEDGVISFYSDDEYYSDSVHGYSRKEFHTFDLVTGEELFLWDVLKIDEVNALDVITRVLFQSSKNTYEYQTLFYSAVRENANLNTKFYLTKNGVHLFWGEFEIGSYAMGEEDLTIAYNRAELVQERFQKGDLVREWSERWIMRDTPARLDLDGDGVEEVVEWRIDKCGENEKEEIYRYDPYFLINGQRFGEFGEVWCNIDQFITMGRFKVAKSDENGSYKELVVSMFKPGEPRISQYYRYVNGSLQLIKESNE